MSDCIGDFQRLKGGHCEKEKNIEFDTRILFTFDGNFDIR